MKFKSLFLTMLGAAAIVSCNNDAIDGGGNGNGNGEVIEGLPIYATMTFKLGKAGTYAGASDVASSPHESTLKDAAVYIYKSDASGATPQCAVFITSLGQTGQNGDGNTVTLRTTSGSKKIFVAANVKQNPATTDMVSLTGLGVVSADWTTLVADLNKTLYSTPSAFTVTAPGSPVYTDPADGLIKNLAMSDLYGTGAGTYTTGSPTPGPNAAFMTNWDGPDDVGTGTGTATPHVGTASITLVPDIDSISSRPTGPVDNNKNQFDINVQRAYAKVSLKFGFTATGATAPNFLSSVLTNKWYIAAAGSQNEGRFFPWGQNTDARWSLGNIPTAELPFQQYVNGVAQDMFYTETTDSIQPAQLTNWFLHYDNTRVFPFSSTITTYPNKNQINVQNTRDTMLKATNYQIFTADNSVNQADYQYAYTTENARLDPVKQDHATYVIFGGFYQPKSVLTNIIRSNVATNNPILGFNGAVLTGNEGAGVSVPGTPYSWQPTSATDTLYYIADDKIFISGKDNLMAYYAWASTQQVNRTAGDAWAALNPNQPITAAAVYGTDGLAFGADVANAINLEIDAKVLYAYVQGQCFYRIFIQNDASATSADRVSVLRNHIYDINITSIKGPGIADPNRILVPGTSVLEQDTYVSATINVLNWHKVDQDKDVDNE
ncbi:MAG: Mfa1 family fimbria major subunit [Tannerella sp.]|jgi:hypothetical protein|nr:Mfa1 family fimbria major subunit [Tannerella sp.]